MDWRLVALIFAGTSLVLAYKTIICNMKSGRTPIIVASWVVWAAEDTLLTIGGIAKGVENSAILLPLIWSIGNLAVLLVILRKEKFAGFEPIDKLCLGLGALGLGAWLFTAIKGNARPELGLAGAAFSIFAGSIPTFRGEFLNPGPIRGWLLFLDGSILDLLAIRDWNFFNMLVPVIGIILQVGIVLSVLLGRMRRSRLKTETEIVVGPWLWP